MGDTGFLKEMLETGLKEFAFPTFVVWGLFRYLIMPMVVRLEEYNRINAEAVEMGREANELNKELLKFVKQLVSIVQKSRKKKKESDAGGSHTSR